MKWSLIPGMISREDGALTTLACATSTDGYVGIFFAGLEIARTHDVIFYYGSMVLNPCSSGFFFFFKGIKRDRDDDEEEC